MMCIVSVARLSVLNKDRTSRLRFMLLSDLRSNLSFHCYNLFGETKEWHPLTISTYVDACRVYVLQQVNIDTDMFNQKHF
jgi:hypothetical protein